MPKSIYLAGKIDRIDWRHGIVKDLYSAIYGNCNGDIFGGKYIDGDGAPEQWPVIPRAVFGLDYTGPYFVEDGHGCTFGPGEHGVGAVESDGRKSEVVKWCLDAIKRSDIVFAWIEDHTAYGTLVELGYAKALGKKIWIAGPDLSYRDVDDHGDPLNELWFAHKLADELVMGTENLTPSAALKLLIPPQFDSPIEEKFWQVWMQIGNPYELTPQHPIGRYYVDFAYVPGQIAIELDGHATHSSPDAIAYDRKRQREIEATGWRVVRFGGKEIFTDAYKCAEEALAILKRFTLKQAVNTGLSRIEQLQERAKTISLPRKECKFKAGDRARHDKFGLGTILRSEISGDIEFVEIQFEGKHDKKYLAAEFARLEKQEPEEAPESSPPALTMEGVQKSWNYIQRRCMTKKGGSKLAALIHLNTRNGFHLVQVEGAQKPPVVVLRATHDFFYHNLAQNEYYLETLEWAMKVELKQECKVQLLEPMPPLPDWPEELEVPQETQEKGTQQ